ncbi:hypothetical protein [Cupriavidus sp. PET2-C1]
MAEATKLDPANRTPSKVLDGMLMAHKPYKSDDCIRCGAVIRMGFFFDGFGRHRDYDDPSTSRYSNICWLWEGHRDMLDRRREQANIRNFPAVFAFRFSNSHCHSVIASRAAAIPP